MNNTYSKRVFLSVRSYLVRRGSCGIFVDAKERNLFVKESEPRAQYPIHKDKIMLMPLSLEAIDGMEARRLGASTFFVICHFHKNFESYKILYDSIWWTETYVEFYSSQIILRSSLNVWYSTNEVVQGGYLYAPSSWDNVPWWKIEFWNFNSSGKTSTKPIFSKIWNFSQWSNSILKKMISV